MARLVKILLLMGFLFLAGGGVSACGNCFASGNQGNQKGKCDFFRTKF